MIDHAASLSADDRLEIHDVERRVKAIFIGSVGNLVEWYDFYAYTAFALYFAPAFFPNSDPVVQQLNAAVLFAATFLMRPLGGWLFGYIADHHGRRLSLTLSVVCMCFGSLIIAITPAYASIGIAAPAILAVARVIEGLSLGGEYGASATYLSEVADAKHRGFYSSFQYVTLIGGQLTAIIVLLLLQKVFLTQQELQEWGWRIPFLIGAMLAIFAAVMRRNLQETEAFEEASKIARPTGSIVGLLKYPRELLLVVGLTAGGTAAFYTFTTYMQTFVRLSVGLTPDQTTLVIFGTLVFATLLQPIYGAISDNIGRKPVLIFFGVVGTLATIPILMTLKETKSPAIAFLLICAAWIFVAGYTSINAVVKAELFPTTVRALGVGLPYAITVSVFGGTAPAVALYFKSLGHEDWFYYYLSGIIFISLIIYTTMRDTKHEIGDASPRVGASSRATVAREMAEESSELPASKLTRTKERWAREGRFLTGKTARAQDQRLPPGQHLTRDWPVLDLGVMPNISRERWRLDVYGEVEHPIFWDFSQFIAQPQTKSVSDIHCVTTWSRYDNQWEGLATRDILAACRPRDEARHVLLHSHDGYTTNLALEDFVAEDALLAHSWSGMPLEHVHGGPVRLVVPHLYFWKSAKWLQSIEFLKSDAPGYWEVRGYHNRGDPWAEQRYSGD